MAAAAAAHALLLVAVFVISSGILVMAADQRLHLPVSSVYNFGDSHSDGGNINAGFPLEGRVVPSEDYPYGVDFAHHKATGRFSDGRLVVDYLAQRLGFQFLPPYFQSVSFGSNFSRGVNFAAGGATVLPDSVLQNPFSLLVQVSQFLKFQGMAFALADSADSSRLPSPDSFADALFIIQMGGGDLAYNLFVQNRTEEHIIDSVIPRVVEGIVDAVTNLSYYGHARQFLIINGHAVGCTPFLLASKHLALEERDSMGCVKSYNNIMLEFNHQLYSAIALLRPVLPNATLVYSDFYQANIDILLDRSEDSFPNATKLVACCGGGGPYNCHPTTNQRGPAVVFSCGCSRTRVCKKPKRHISWDGIHFTQQFNWEVANKYFEESCAYLDPDVKFVRS